MGDVVHLDDHRRAPVEVSWAWPHDEHDWHPLCETFDCLDIDDHRPVFGPSTDDVAEVDWSWVMSLVGYYGDEPGPRDPCVFLEHRDPTIIDGFWWTGPPPPTPQQIVAGLAARLAAAVDARKGP